MVNKLYLIGNSHIDPVWLWRWQEGFSEILATFRSALDRMKEFDYLVYTSACAAYYQWVEQADPDMFEEIRARVKEGRWNIVGGWFIQPDCNIPGGEGFARQGLISQRYFMEKFGIMAKTAYNVDSFGHNASLPQIFKKSGMANYVFMRPGPHENAELDDIFIWESADGSKVNTYRIPHRYCITEDCMDIFDDIKRHSEDTGRSMMAFYGVGNHGGGPTIKLLAKMKDYPVLEDAVYTSVDDFFAQTSFDNAITVKDELQHHAVGCYSACSFVKKSNRRAESNLIAAEKMCLMASELAGREYPALELKKAWKNVLFNHFHDILAGCAIEEAYTDAAYSYGETMAITEKAINLAATSIARKIDTLRGKEMPSYKIAGTKGWRVWETDSLGTPVVIFNTLCHEVDTLVEITTPADRVTDKDGNEIPLQKVRSSHTNGEDYHYSSFRVKLPAYGYSVYRIFPNGTGSEYTNPLKITENSIENNKILVKFEETTGEIKSVYDKTKEEYIINSPCRTILTDETACDTWAHDQERLGEEVASFGNPVFEIVDQGPVKATLRVTTTCESSTLTRDYSLRDDCDTLTVKTRVDFHEKHRALKIELPVTGNEIISAIPYGTVRRPAGTGEESCQEYVACANLGIANDCIYGYDSTENSVRLTALRGAVYADHYGQNHRENPGRYMEQGLHEFVYTIFPYSNNADAARRASELNTAPIVYTDSFHAGKLGEEMSCFKTDSVNTVVTAIKKSEDGEGTVIRLCEYEGDNSQVKAKLFDTEIDTKINHNEIKTLKIQGPDIKEVNLIEY